MPRWSTKITSRSAFRAGSAALKLDASEQARSARPAGQPDHRVLLGLRRGGLEPRDRDLDLPPVGLLVARYTPLCFVGEQSPPEWTRIE
ncbi:hypothetical protein AB0J74_32820 [Asanoa sp. NPDC049573]|uniref:hypothetical protein n=1 Tax=Asanoa sp. NPDC049573 TaxID=3155396 RepID=UPI00344933EF